MFEERTSREDFGLLDPVPGKVIYTFDVYFFFPMHHSSPNPSKADLVAVIDNRSIYKLGAKISHSTIVLMF
jgi:hypothetical protein